MTQYLPPNLLALFAPREPIPYLPPSVRLTHERKTRGYFGVGQYLDLFEDPKDTPPPLKIETKEERLERRKREKAEKSAYIREQGIALWDPHNNASATHDPYKTLFIARINPDLSESRLKKEFEAYGPIRKISLIHDKISGKFKGYAFIEYENEKDMHAAYKHADGKKLEGRRVLVDVERGRTVKGWLPRRLGGGLSDKPKVYREERDERSFRGSGGDRYDRRERDRYHRSSSRDRRDYRRRRSRSREKDRSDRDRVRDRDRGRDRSDRDRDRRDRHDRGFDEFSEPKMEKMASRGYGENDGYNNKRHRSRSRERKRYTRTSRSRSGSPRAERKRARSGFEGNGERHYQEYEPGPLPDHSGELEEGEDRSGYGGYGVDENYVYVKKEPDYESDEYTNSQPAFAGYKD